MKQILAEHNLFGLSGQETWDTSSIQTLLGVSEPFIQRYLRAVNTDTLAVALCGDGIGAVRFNLLQNMGKSEGALLVNEIEKASPTDQEIDAARSELTRVLQQELTAYEEELWEDYRGFLAPEVKDVEPDLYYLMGLDISHLKDLFRSSSARTISEAVGSSKDWAVLLHQVLPYLDEDKVEKITCEDNNPCFLWQIEIAQRYLTDMGKLLEARS